MPQGGNRYISKYLTNYSNKYTNDEYIADKIFTSDVGVKQETGKIAVYNYERLLEETLRANGTPANMATWGMSYTSYAVEEHAIKDVITDRDRRNADSVVQVEQSTIENLKDKIMLRQEKQAADLVFGNSWSQVTTNTSATSWRSNTTTSNPIGNVLSATGVILRNTGKQPNCMVVGWQVYEGLKENPQVYDRLAYTERGILTADILAAMFDIDKLLVGKASYNTAQEGLTPTTTFMWGNKAWLAYMSPNPGLRKISAALRLRVDGTSMPYKVTRWRGDEVDGDYYQLSTMSQPIAIATLAAYMWSNAAV